MEYVEQGSLEQRLESGGVIPTDEAVDLFREIVVGITHAHRKGVLHCDLKPANILLDQDHRPRVADFGQSRLSNEQRPSLGTLFYMAPEQADIEAVPDSSWDIYALGALLYCMLTGSPPHRDVSALTGIDSSLELEARLQRYRAFVRQAERPKLHRLVPGVDRALSDIVDRCLDPNPEQRFRDAQAILDALDEREANHQRRPLMVLGIVGPLVLLAVMGLFAWQGYRRSLEHQDRVLIERARDGNQFAAKFAAEVVSHRIHRFFQEVEGVANDRVFRTLLDETMSDPELRQMIESLNGDDLGDSPRRAILRAQFENHPTRAKLQRFIASKQSEAELGTASWFTTDALGLHLASAFDAPPDKSPIGGNYSYRSYFHGGEDDLRQPESRGALRVSPIGATYLSAPFQSTATHAWKIAISTPVMHDGNCLAVVALTVDLGSFTKLGRVPGAPNLFAVIVDGRHGHFGQILQHPLFGEVLRDHEKLPDRFSEYRVPLDSLVSQPASARRLYRDPLGDDPLGDAYQGEWIAAHAQVQLSDATIIERRANASETEKSTGLVVLVQEHFDTAARPVHEFADTLFRLGRLALFATLAVILLLWSVVYRLMKGPRGRSPVGDGSMTPTLHSMDTVELPPRLR